MELHAGVCDRLRDVVVWECMGAGGPRTPPCTPQGAVNRQCTLPGHSVTHTLTNVVRNNQLALPNIPHSSRRGQGRTPSPPPSKQHCFISTPNNLTRSEESFTPTPPPRPLKNQVHERTLYPTLHKALVNSLRPSTWLTGGYDCASASSDGTVKVFDIETGWGGVCFLGGAFGGVLCVGGGCLGGLGGCLCLCLWRGE